VGIPFLHFTSGRELTRHSYVSELSKPQC
jgi:hypothetical protein